MLLKHRKAFLITGIVSGTLLVLSPFFVVLIGLLELHCSIDHLVKMPPLPLQQGLDIDVITIMEWFFGFIATLFVTMQSVGYLSPLGLCMIILSVLFFRETSAKPPVIPK
jgi:hypothetical protein